MRGSLAAVGVGLTMVVSCSTGTSDVGTDAVFDAATTELTDAPPDSDVLQLKLGKVCRTVERFWVDQTELDLVGSGAALFGDLGARYQCAWGGEADGLANVRLEVVILSDAGDLDVLEEQVASRGGNEVVETAAGPVSVASFTPDGAPWPTTTSVLFDRSHGGVIQLLIELVDNGLRKSWTAADHAEVLASFGQP